MPTKSDLLFTLTKKEMKQLAKEYGDELVILDWRGSTRKARTKDEIVEALESSRKVSKKTIKSFINSKSKKTELSNADSKKIFIVHGKDDTSKLELARLLENDFKLKSIILHEQPDEGKTIIEKIESNSDIGYAFIILTPDDKYIDKSNEAHYRSRQNVIFEFGYFIAKLGRDRVCVLYKEGIGQIPSDINGVVYKKFNQSIIECYRAILKELRKAGYEIII